MILATFVLGVGTMPTQAEEPSGSITQKLASHTYVIPRDILNNIYKPDHSRELSPNPNWSYEPEIRLRVQWPDFEASSETKQPEDRVTIWMLSLDEHPITSVEQVLKHLAKSGQEPTLAFAEYELKEINGGLAKADGIHEFIATPDGSMSFLIRCILRERPLTGNCQFFFPYKNISVKASFWWPHFKDWKNIYEKTVSLLDGMRKD